MNPKRELNAWESEALIPWEGCSWKKVPASYPLESGVCVCTDVRPRDSTPFCCVTSTSVPDKVARLKDPPGWSIIPMEECVECCCPLAFLKGKAKPLKDFSNDDAAGCCFQNRHCHNPTFEDSVLLWFCPKLSGPNSPACGFIVLC